MNELVRVVEQGIERHRLFRRGEKLLVAVSGGLDSMVLLRVLHELAAVHGWQLVVAHFNHHLRGRASEADAALVRRTADRLGWPCVIEHGRVADFAAEKGLSIEMAARQLRHEFLAHASRRRKIRTVALAHHADDQVELFFLRLLRGAGCEGLAGMKYSSPSPSDRHVRLARPLLDLSKEALRAFASEHTVAFREDASNASLHIQRNRIRHELLPLLRRHYQPALDQVVPRLMNLLGDTAGFLSQEAEAWLAAPATCPFATLHPALQRVILQAQLIKLGVRLDYGLVDRLRESANTPVMVAPNTQIWRGQDGRLFKEESGTASFPSARLELNLSLDAPPVEFDGVALAWERWSGHCRRRRREAEAAWKSRIRLSTLIGAAPAPILPAKNSEGALPEPPAKREWFDADRVGAQVIVRHWQRGDRFQPLGLASPIKLQDWFTNRKIPRQLRHRLLVATTAAGEVFWIEDQRIAEGFKVTDQTRQVLQWEWKRSHAPRL